MKKFDSEFKDSGYIEFGIIDGNTGENQYPKYVEGVLKKLESDLPDFFDREIVLAGAEKRKLNSPATETTRGTMRGSWNGSIFVLNDDYVPEKYNSAGYTVAQIKNNLFDIYGIKVDGIPYVDGVADFSVISVANIPTADIVTKATGMSHKEYESLGQKERTKIFQTVFSSAIDGKSKRERNFDYADQVASEKQIPIPGLSKGYTAAQLKKWRLENKFSWDEQVNAGYNLVPTIIHGNISHTGLVSTSGNAYSFLERHTRDMVLHPEKFCWDEENAPISISELENYERRTKKKQKRR